MSPPEGVKFIKHKVYEDFISFLTLDEILKAPHEICKKLKSIVDRSGFEIFEETEECVALANAYSQGWFNLAD